jgi:hypothetical protein
MHRLFSNFANGAPGIGLLLMRASAAAVLVVHGFSVAPSALSLPAVIHIPLSVALGVLLLAGLWTPMAGTLLAAEGLRNLFSPEDPSRWILLATDGAALVLIGPGIWSIDALLFGRRRVDLGSP